MTFEVGDKVLARGDRYGHVYFVRPARPGDDPACVRIGAGADAIGFQVNRDRLEAPPLPIERAALAVKAMVTEKHRRFVRFAAEVGARWMWTQTGGRVATRVAAKHVVKWGKS